MGMDLSLAVSNRRIGHVVEHKCEVDKPDRNRMK